MFNHVTHIQDELSVNDWWQFELAGNNNKKDTMFVQDLAIDGQLPTRWTKVVSLLGDRPTSDHDEIESTRNSIISVQVVNIEPCFVLSPVHKYFEALVGPMLTWPWANGGLRRDPQKDRYAMVASPIACIAGKLPCDYISTSNSFSPRPKPRCPLLHGRLPELFQHMNSIRLAHGFELFQKR